jgi:hypothetical protein
MRDKSLINETRKNGRFNPGRVHGTRDRIAHIIKMESLS